MKSSSEGIIYTSDGAMIYLRRNNAPLELRWKHGITPPLLPLAEITNIVFCDFLDSYLLYTDNGELIRLSNCLTFTVVKTGLQECFHPMVFLNKHLCIGQGFFVLVLENVENDSFEEERQINMDLRERDMEIEHLAVVLDRYLLVLTEGGYLSVFNLAGERQCEYRLEIFDESWNKGFAFSEFGNRVVINRVYTKFYGSSMAVDVSRLFWVDFRCVLDGEGRETVEIVMKNL